MKSFSLFRALVLGVFLFGSFLCGAQGARLQVTGTTTPPLLDVPTYSLATTGPDGRTAMNILTYATPVSATPVRMWALSLFKGCFSLIHIHASTRNFLKHVCLVLCQPTLRIGTTTHANFLREKTGILQLLTPKHSGIVRCLGGTSMNKDATVNKQEVCASLGYAWVDIDIEEADENRMANNTNRIPMLLPKCAGYLRLTMRGDAIDVGGHDVALCQVSPFSFPVFLLLLLLLLLQ